MKLFREKNINTLLKLLGIVLQNFISTFVLVSESINEEDGVTRNSLEGVC